jgi:membrane glycosyltransferase
MTESARPSPAIDLVDDMTRATLEPALVRAGDRADVFEVFDLVDPTHATSTTPTGTQSTKDLRARRHFVLSVNLATYCGLAVLMARIVGSDGWTLVDGALFLCFLIATPWTVLGFWNAILGLWLLHGRSDGFAQVAPFAVAGERSDPLRVRTAIVMTLRNEDPSRAMARLRAVEGSLERTGQGDAFAYFILSDTSDPAVAAAEEKAVEGWRRSVRQPKRIVYRRRRRNTGFKAGNVRDFCESYGRDYDLMLPLDADSLMAGATIVRLVRIMQAHPRLGILQSLVVGVRLVDRRVRAVLGP